MSLFAIRSREITRAQRRAGCVLGRRGGGAVLGGVLLVLMVLLAGMVDRLPAQNTVYIRPGQTVPDPFDGFPPYNPMLAHRQLLALNAERQKKMVRDTDRLLKLATDLNAEIKAGKSAGLTSAELAKVARIEKLARSVRDKMIFSASSSPMFNDPFYR